MVTMEDYVNKKCSPEVLLFRLPLKMFSKWICVRSWLLDLIIYWVYLTFIKCFIFKWFSCARDLEAESRASPDTWVEEDESLILF